MGAVGLVGTTSHWTGPQFQRMFTAFRAGRVAEAREVHAALLPSLRSVNSDEVVYSMAVKAMMRVLGHKVGDCRLPLPPCPPGVEQKARAVLETLAP